MSFGRNFSYGKIRLAGLEQQPHVEVDPPLLFSAYPLKGGQK
jgi:hypothetical protein